NAGELDGISGLEELPARQFRGQFHDRHIAHVEVEAGQVFHAHTRVVYEGLASGHQTGLDGFVAVDARSPQGAIALGHEGVTIVGCLRDITGAHAEVNRLGTPADIEV